MMHNENCPMCVDRYFFGPDILKKKKKDSSGWNNSRNIPELWTITVDATDYE
jgi:hypothetical protein